LSKSYLILIAIAICCAVPLSRFANNLWLQTIGNRIDTTFSASFIGVLLLLIIALVTISSQTLAAVRTSPTEILMHE